mmetsp:Transcript_3274/g.7771  ORF Transcript_3274/g.7771 Transcript_3274/m.7771 type:complete len:527 (-) Transcript_3274:1566-3146(-)
MPASQMPLHRSVTMVLLLHTISIASGWVIHNSCTTPWSHIANEACVSPKISTPLFASTTENEEIIEYLDDDDDDDEDEDDSGANYDPEAALEQQAAWMEELERLSKATSVDPTAIESFQEIFDSMFQAFVESDDATFFPTTDVYNLMLETHAYSRSEEGADEAERILDRMEDADNDFVAKPNEETYICVMDAWAIRHQPLKAKAILERQESPSVESYNKLIRAFGMDGDLEQAESTFRSILEQGIANHKSWVQVMKAAASDDDDGVQEYFDEMQEKGIEPETDAYNVLIRSVGKSKGYSEAEAILFQMIASYREGDEQKKPNSGTFRSLLTVYKAHGSRQNPASAAKVEQLLQFMEGLVTPQELEESSDTTAIFRMALELIMLSKDSKKASKANRILGKLHAPTHDMYVSVLKACASTYGNADTKHEAFQVALGVIKELRANGQSTSSTTGLFLQVCHRLMPQGSKRDDLVIKIFNDCSEEGLVSEFVLDEFEAATTEATQLEVLGGFSVDGVSIPESWSRNVATP